MTGCCPRLDQASKRELTRGASLPWLNGTGRLFPVGWGDQSMNREDIWPTASSLQTSENWPQNPRVVGRSPQVQSSSFHLQVAGEDGVPGLPGRRE